MSDYRCQYCGDGPFQSTVQQKVHEQNFCDQRPADIIQTSVLKETNGQSGHLLDDEQKTKWEQENGRVTRLQFFRSDPNFVIPQRLQGKLGRVITRREHSTQHIWFVGDAGMGKTGLALEFAAITKSPTYKAPCPAMTEVSQWMGRTAFEPERGTFYIPSVFVEAIETENAVVILNDATRVENPKVLNPLMDVCDEIGATWCEEMGREVRVAKGVVFFATSNEGWQYTGADEADVGLKDRFDVIPIPLPPPEIISQIVYSKVDDTPEIRTGVEFFLQCIRKGLPLSLRHALRLAADIKYGASLVDAAMLGMIGNMTSDQQTEALQILQVKSSSLGGVGDLEVEDRWSHWNG
ncbi:hypothetical protein LCGC14_0811020 [marine sediment metagenome]|uniref:ATPase dynein-related AAA domain-containing protein n=1 Tax=marine sediment metagenome TaxID=412755 RepID=A0A0F9S6M7_9ZZZZ